MLMKKIRALIIFIIVLAVLACGIKVILNATAEYPKTGEEVTYTVNDVEGFDLEIEDISWSFIKGYTIKWQVNAESKEVYYFVENGSSFNHIERNIDGKWYKLGTDVEFLATNTFALGGEEGYGLGGSLVQKYDGYGTRLEKGKYRLVLEMENKKGNKHYLAEEFEIE